LKRILLTIEYDGTRYAGWQRQNNGLAVQQVLETALARATGQASHLTGASRTDAGVHALGQRAHFDTASNIPDEKWPFVLNTLLPPDIRVTVSQRVSDALHARFDAQQKTYEYRILNRRHNSALRHSFCAFVPLPLDVDRMRQAARDLVGRHDFAAFQAAGGNARTTVRTIHSALLTQQGDELVLKVCGDAFLYNMVRIIAGTLIAIGQGKLDTDAFRRALDSKDRLDLGITAPACGLCLVRVDYEGLP